MKPRPSLPPDEPLRGEYANYMLDRMDSVDSMISLLFTTVVVLVVFTVLGMVAFAVFAYQKWRERQDLQAWRLEVRNLLAVIKGWTVVNKSSSDRAVVEVTEKITKATEEIPKKTADEVVSQLEVIKLSDSGTVRNIPPRSSPPPAPG